MPTTTVATENLAFKDGVSVLSITIPIAADILVEEIEDFDLALTLRGVTLAATNVLLLPNRHTSTVYILDRTGNSRTCFLIFIFLLCSKQKFKRVMEIFINPIRMLLKSK